MEHGMKRLMAFGGGNIPTADSKGSDRCIDVPPPVGWVHAGVEWLHTLSIPQ